MKEESCENCKWQNELDVCKERREECGLVDCWEAKEK